MVFGVDSDNGMKRYGESMAGNVGIWQRVIVFDVTTQTNYVDITGLDGNEAKFYNIFGLLRSVVGKSGTRFFLRPNNDVNSANYFMRYWHSGGGTGTETHPGIDLCYVGNGGDFAFMEGLFAVMTNKPRIYAGRTAEGVSTTNITVNGTKYSLWKNVTDNITNFRLTSNHVNGIGAGSYLEIWKMV